MSRRAHEPEQGRLEQRLGDEITPSLQAPTPRRDLCGGSPVRLPLGPRRGFATTVAAAFVALLAWPAAQVWADDLADLYRLALQRDPTLEAAAMANQATQEGLRQAWAGLLPTVRFSSGVEHARQDVLTSDNFLIQEGTSSFENWDLNLALSQAVFRYDAIVRVQQARDASARGRLEYYTAEQELMLRVSQLYLEALSARDALGFARAEQAALQLQFERTQGQHAKGLAPVTDLYDARARLAAAEGRVILAQNDLDDALQALRAVTGDWEGELAGIRGDLPLRPPDPDDVDVWIEAGLAQNLSLQAAAMAVAVAEQEVARLQAGHYPTVDLVARGIRDHTGGDLFGDGRDTEIYNVRVELNLPLYQGGLLRSQVRSASYTRERIRKERERLEREVETQTRSAYGGVLSAIGRVRAQAQAVAALELALQGRQTGFRSGLFPSIDVLDGVRDLYMSRRDYARARYDYILNSLRLKQVVGTLSPDDLGAVNQWLSE